MIVDPKFKVGDEVVCTERHFWFGRPKIRKIESIEVRSNGQIRYNGGSNEYMPFTWSLGEDHLVLASEFEWPSELEMRIMDKKYQDDMQRSFEEIARHEEEP